MIHGVRNVPEPINSREHVVRSLTAQGFSLGLARWMTTNLRRTTGQYEWTFDLDAIEELMVDYRACDLWPYLESEDKPVSVHMLVAERSDRLSGTTRARAAALGPTARVFTHLLENSGHWVHVDNPDGLMSFFTQYWPDHPTA